MPDISKSIELIFGYTDNISGGLTGLGNNLDTFSTKVGNITSPLANLTTGLLKTETAVLALAAAYGGFAISKAIEFQNAQIDLAKVLSDTDPDVESFTQTVIDLSEQYGVASASILQGIADFKQAGFSAKESAQLQKDALDLVIAGDINAAAASELLVSTLKGMNAEFDEAPRFIEALNNVSNNYATDLEQLAIGMANISPILDVMGFSFEEGIGAVTPIIEVFRSGSEAATALKTGLLSLISDTKPVTEALANIGVSQKDVNDELRSGKDIFNDVSQALVGLNDNQKLVFAEQVFGKQQAARLLTVFSDLGKVTAITSVAMEKTGSVTKEVGLRLDSASKQIDRTTQSFNNLSKAVGSELLPSFGSVLDGTQDIIQALRDVVEKGGLSELFDALDAQGKDFGQFLSDVAKAIPEAFAGLNFSELLASFSELKGSVKGIFGDLDLTDAKDLQTLLQKLVDFLALFTNASAGAIEGFTPLIEGFVFFLEKLADSDADTQTFIGGLGGIATVIDTLLPLLGFVADAIILVGSSLTILGAAKGTGALAKIAGSLVSISPTNVALAGAIGAVTFAINENIDAYDELQQREKSIQKDEEHLNETRGEIVSRLKEISATTGITVKTMDDFNDAVDTGALVFNEATGKYENGTKAIVDYDKVVGDAVENQITWADTVEGVSETLESMGIAIDTSVVGLKSLGQQQREINDEIAKAEELGQSYNVVIEDGVARLKTWGGTTEDASKALEKSSTGLEKLTESQKLAIEQTGKLELQLNELASNEKIAAMEFTANIKVAQFESQAKQVVAQLDAMATGLTSNNELVGELFSHDAPDWDKFGFATEDAIDDANRRADDLNQSIVDMNNAQIENLNARTKQLAEGGSLITINADNLAVELQALMKGFADAVRIEAVNNGLEILI